MGLETRRPGRDPIRSVTRNLRAPATIPYRRIGLTGTFRLTSEGLLSLNSIVEFPWPVFSVFDSPTLTLSSFSTWFADLRIEFHRNTTASHRQATV
jgi:hypothetical protein